jgi:ribonuclease-3
MSEENIPRLARKLGIPKDKISILREALTHRTCAVEHHLAYDNQRLEFLGDSVLEIVHTEALFRRYPELPEGDLTKIRSALSCEMTLAQIARTLELGSYLLIGNGERECAGYDRDSTLCDLFEAVLGALYLSCGMEKTAAFIHKLFDIHCPEPKDLLTTLNPKGRLQEYTQGKWHKTPEYRLFRHSGPQHEPLFEVEVRAANYCTIGSGSSRKLAETDAAAKLLKFFIRKFKA